MTTAVSTFDDLLDNTDLAVSWPGVNRTERYVYREGRLFKHGEERGVDPFFFTGLIAQGAIVHGDFAPPQTGEWFGYRNGRRTGYQFYVVSVAGQKVDFIYFIRGEYAGWTETVTDRIFDEYARVATEDAPTITPEMFQSLARSAADYKSQAETRQAQVRNARDALQQMRYARDYVTAAITGMERT